MGYFSNIIKDSRINLVAHHNSQTPSAAPDTQFSARRADPFSMPESPSRSMSADRSRKEPPAEVKTDAASLQGFPVVSAEIVSSSRSKSKTKHAASGIKNSRRRPDAGDEPTGPEEAAAATGKPGAAPVIQRKAMSRSAPRSTRTARPLPGAARQPESMELHQPAEGQGQIRPARSARQLPMEAVPQSSRSTPSRKATSGVNHQSGKPGKSKTFNSQASAAIDPATADSAERPAASAGQPTRLIETSVPIEASLKIGTTKPQLPVSPLTDATKGKYAATAVGAHDDSPRVRIGQVNIIVEESKVPAKSPSGLPRTDDLGSRNFLRSL